MMRKLLILLITLFCPGIIFILTEKYVKACVAFGLQLSIIGWIPAIIWARKDWGQNVKPEKTPKQKIQRAQPAQTLTPTPKKSESRSGDNV